MLAILLASLVGVASAAFGPASLYNSLSTQTLNLNGYVIQPYLQVSNGNVSYGQFNDYVATNGVYTYQYYTGGSSVGCASARSMKLYIDCGSTTSLGPVSEPMPCSYQSVLTVPQACGISFDVGSEFASPSPAPKNATVAAATSSSADGYIGMILGAVGVSGVGVVIAIQVYNSMKNKGGLKALFTAHSATIDKVLDKVPVSDSVKKSLKDVASKQVEKLDSVVDEKLKTTRQKIAKLEGRKEEIEVDVVPSRSQSPVAQKTQKFSQIRRSSIDLDIAPASKVTSPVTEAPKQVVVRALSPHPIPIIPEPEPAREETAKLEISLNDLEEIKKLLERRNKKFAVAE